MNVVTIDLSAQLYELSGWEDTTFVHRETYSIYRTPEFRFAVIRRTGLTKPFLKDWDMNDVEEYKQYVPAYDLGYLLRKLPHYVENGIYAGYLSLDCGTEAWRIAYADVSHAFVVGSGEWTDTPEDATAKLAISLFEQGVLKKEGQDNE